MRNYCLSSPSDNLTMLAKVAKVFAKWLCARGIQANVMFQNFRIKQLTHF